MSWFSEGLAVDDGDDFVSNDDDEDDDEDVDDEVHPVFQWCADEDVDERSDDEDADEDEDEEQFQVHVFGDEEGKQDPQGDE